MTHQLATQLIHAGEVRPRYGGAISMPIFQSANYEYAGEADYDQLVYSRLNNTPNHRALHDKLAAIEGGETALVTGSGMAAISTAVLSVLKAGDHLLAQDCLYGGTHSLFTQDLRDLGIEVTLVSDENWHAHLRPETRGIYVETMSNPLLQVPDLAAVVGFAREHNLVSMIDNTFASPVNFRPLDLGFDLSLHSATKYLNGHSDLAAGAIIGRHALLKRATHLANHLGGCLDPHDCFLLHRGMKTLLLRVRQQNENAQRLAEFLEAHAAVARVHYPGLPSHPGHERARRWFQGCGGVLSFELQAGLEAAQRFIQQLRFVPEAPSLGGVESLVTRPATTSHAGLTAAERQTTGISDGLIRVAVGIEDVTDLIEEFAQALA